MKGYISKSEELNKIIEQLYQIGSELDCEIICDQLDKVYLNEDGQINEQFRHEYSSISGKIRELNEVEIAGRKIYILDYLLENINNLYDYACKKEKPYINNLFKLKDHIGLEIGRILLVEQLKWEISNGQESVTSQLTYMRDISVEIGNQIQQSRGLLNDLQNSEKENERNVLETKESIEQTNQLAEDMKDKIEAVQRDSITILGIFASIVLSFTAGIVFTSSVLENIDKASPYRIVGVVLLLGFVITNVITVMFMYIDKIKSVRHTEMKYPKSIKKLNWLYIAGIVVDFCIWILMYKVIP